MRLITGRLISLLQAVLPPMNLLAFFGGNVRFWLDPKTNQKDHGCEENA
jgi:hypothetical protein